MKIALASDHVGLILKQEIALHLKKKEIEIIDFGTYGKKRCDYPKYAFLAAQAIQKGECDRGIICCGTGVGMSIAANKVRGIRCVCCSDPYSAKLSREHNNTNMLAMGSRVTGAELALMIVEVWLTAEYEEGRHRRRLDMIAEMESCFIKNS